MTGDCNSLSWFGSPFPCTGGTFSTDWYLDGVLVASNVDPYIPTGTGDYTAVVTCDCCGPIAGCSYTSNVMTLDCSCDCFLSIVDNGDCTITASTTGNCNNYNDIQITDGCPAGVVLLSGPSPLTLVVDEDQDYGCLLYTSPSPRDQRGSRMPSSA